MLAEGVGAAAGGDRPRGGAATVERFIAARTSGAGGPAMNTRALVGGARERCERRRGAMPAAELERARSPSGRRRGPSWPPSGPRAVADRRVQAPLPLGRGDQGGPRPRTGDRGLRARGAPPRSRSSPRPFFGGALDDLVAARSPPSCRSCARTSSSTATRCSRRGAAGADAVLLIVAALPRRARGAAGRRERARAEGLVEAHDERDEVARPARARRSIGINNRDLVSSTSIPTAFELRGGSRPTVPWCGVRDSVTAPRSTARAPASTPS